MIELIALIIFFISVSGMVFIIYKKIPALVQLPQSGSDSFQENHFISNIARKIKDTHFHFFEKQMLLHKVLSKFRLLVLKTERKIGDMLHGIRKNAQQLDKENEKK